MNILSKITSWFGYNRAPIQTHETDEDENSITFSIDGFGRPWVSMSLANTDEQSCKSFAKMLNGINYGEYEQNMLDILVNLSKEKPSMAGTIQSILHTWANILANEEAASAKPNKNTENKPFIRPRNVFLGPEK